MAITIIADELIMVLWTIAIMFWTIGILKIYQPIRTKGIVGCLAGIDLVLILVWILVIVQWVWGH